MPLQYWLLKSEPGVYSIGDLERDRVTCWEGVRNYQARNFLRDRLKKGDLVFFYHSNGEPSGIAGIAKVAREGYPEPKHEPWFMVDIEFVEKFPEVLALEALKKSPALKDMPVVQRGQRLSVQPVTPAQWKTVLALQQGR